jgi:hypothetical protein
VGFERLECALRQHESASAQFRLRLCEKELAINNIQCPLDAEYTTIEIDVSPLQTKQLTLTHARCNGKYEERFETLTLCCLKEKSCLLGRECQQFVPLDTWRKYQVGDIPLDEAQA